MNTLLSKDQEDSPPKEDDIEIASDLMDDINKMDDFFLQNQLALELENLQEDEKLNENLSQKDDKDDKAEKNHEKNHDENHEKNHDENYDENHDENHEKNPDENDHKNDHKNDDKNSMSFSSENSQKKFDVNNMEIESSFHCSLHLFHPITNYCLIDSKFLCKVCKLDHFDHKESLRDYADKNLLSEIEKLNAKLLQTKTITNEFLAKIKGFHDKNLEFITSEQITTFFRSIHGFFSVSPLSLISQKTLRKTLKTRDFFPESLLIRNTEEEAFIISLFNEKVEKNAINLLYRGSRDGFNSSFFHQFCDKKGANLIVIKSEKNRIFGGFTSKSWKSREKPEFHKDEKSFLFSLNGRTHHKILEKFEEKAVYFADKKGPVFGAGFDLYISENCDIDRESFSNLGISYECEEEMETEEIRRYLAGEIYFNVKEIEVFAIGRVGNC